MVLGELALALTPFWSGMPAAFGASAARLAGPPKGGPQTGVTRSFGIAGFVAILVAVATLVGFATYFFS